MPEQTPFTEETVSAKKLRPHQKLPITVQEFGDVVNAVKAGAFSHATNLIEDLNLPPSAEIGKLLMELKSMSKYYSESETPSERLMEFQQYDLANK